MKEKELIEQSKNNKVMKNHKTMEKIKIMLGQFLQIVQKEKQKES